jgi:signal transduction histidine kinase/CheY-like chemotaxis protein
LKKSTKRFIGAILIYVLGVMGIVAISYLSERQRYLESIDERLMAAASAVEHILEPDFHDIARTHDAVSEEQNKAHLELMNRHAQSGNLTYLYSYVMVDGMIYFTSCNYTAEDVRLDRVVNYWTAYPEGAPEYFAAMTSKEPIYVTAGDRWGLFRTILLPRTSPGGLPYVVAADMDISVIEASLWRGILSGIGLSIILLLIITPLIVVYRKTYAEMNEELVVLNKQLLKDIDQAMVLESELKKATHKANTANEIKSQFLSNMSHELRTPINGVVGMNQLLMDTELNNVQYEYASLCNQSAHVLLDTVNQILDVATIETQGLTITSEPLLCKSFFNNIVSMFGAHIAEKRIDLNLHLNNGIPEQIHIDPIRLRQVLINLISNAIKFTHRGGIRVNLEWENGVLIGEVQDTGIGIPIDAQQRIFEKFQQVDNSSSRQYGGTGLGLPISEQICRAMDGELKLKYSDEQGSVFVFNMKAPAVNQDVIAPMVLPIDDPITVITKSTLIEGWLNSEVMNPACFKVTKDVEDVLDDNDNCRVIVVDAGMGVAALNTLSESLDLNRHRLVWLAWFGQKLPASLEGRVDIVRKPLLRSGFLASYHKAEPLKNKKTMTLSGRILVVDDNPANLRVMGDQLESTGLTVDLAEDGSAALLACLSQTYDLVLMDVQMPGMNGLDTTRQIHIDLGDKAPPIVGVSALVLEKNHENAAQAGMVGYLNKPITKQELLDKVIEFIKQEV